MFTVRAEGAAFVEKAETLAERLNLSMDAHHVPCLCVGAAGLALHFPGFSPLIADFEKSRQRVARNRGKREALVRACKPAPGLYIVDATAGWGRDAAVLACYGARVTMIERNPILHALLEDALTRSPFRENLSLVQADAAEWLSAQAPQALPDVIYLDPMHPTRQKSALVQKDMQILQQLITDQPSPAALLAVARSLAKQTVVVKWPQKNAPLAPPTSSIPGKTVRFDLYTSLQSSPLPHAQCGEG